MVNIHIKYQNIHQKMKQKHILDGLKFWQNLNGKYWKDLSFAGKSAYLHIAEKMLEMNETDEVLDIELTNTLEGSVDTLISTINSLTSYELQEVDVPHEDKLFNCPEELRELIRLIKSHYYPSKLIESTKGYQPDPDTEASYINRLNEDGKVKMYEITSEMQDIAFEYWDRIWDGIEYLNGLSIYEQHELIRASVKSGVNQGYDSYGKQSKSGISAWMLEFSQKKGFKLPHKFNPDDEKMKDFKFPKETPLTVDNIFAVVHWAKDHKYYPPFSLYYRGHVPPKYVRSVFGGDSISKLVAAMFKAARAYGLSIENLDKQGTERVPDKYNELGTTAHHILNEDEEVISRTDISLPCKNGIPIKADINWDILFNLLVDKFPKDHDDKPRVLMEHFGIKLDPDWDYDIVGEDYKSFDKGVAPPELWFLKKHKKLGWLFEYFLDCMENSEVWAFVIRIAKIFYKSGHPFTAAWGTHVHENRQMAFCNWVNSWTKEQCIKFIGEYVPAPRLQLLGTCNQSDDNISFWYGHKLVMEKLLTLMEIWNKAHGMFLKSSASYSWNKLPVVGFLKVWIGNILDGHDPTFGADPMSRIHGLCHREREISEDTVDVALDGVFIITGDKLIDAVISNLGSFGESWLPLVMVILDAIKHTPIGSRVIRAIDNIDISREPIQYTTDRTSFDYRWLKKIEVQEMELRAKVVV